MQNKFISMNASTGKLSYHINTMMICGITKYEEFSIINTIGGQVYSVKETPDEIMKLIENSEKWTLITK